jgi:hypothetical protein
MKSAGKSIAPPLAGTGVKGDDVVGLPSPQETHITLLVLLMM